MRRDAGGEREGVGRALVVEVERDEQGGGVGAALAGAGQARGQPHQLLAQPHPDGLRRHPELGLDRADAAPSGRRRGAAPRGGIRPPAAGGAGPRPPAGPR